MITTAQHGHVRLVTFDRPEVRNAFDLALYAAVTSALRQAEGDDEVRVVVLTGAGQAFSAGQDLDELAELAAGRAPDGAERGFRDLLEVVQAYDLPLLAAVNGAAVGLGMTLLAHCDLVLVSETARLKVPFAELGVPLEAGSSWLLPERMGWQAAAHALLSSAWLDADEAVASGLAWRRCAPDELVAATLGAAAEIAAHPRAALVTIKRLLVAGRLPAVVAAREREEAAFAELFATGGRGAT